MRSRRVLPHAKALRLCVGVQIELYFLAKRQLDEMYTL